MGRLALLQRCGGRLEFSEFGASPCLSDSWI